MQRLVATKSGTESGFSLFLPHGSGTRQEDLTPLCFTLFAPLITSLLSLSANPAFRSLQISAGLGGIRGRNGVWQADEESVLVAVWIFTALQSESLWPHVNEARD